MEHGFDFSQETRQWVSPTLIEANYILSLSQQELQQVIEAEMAQNPALELDDRPTCPVCDSVLEGNFCSTCRTTVTRDADPDVPTESYDSMDDNIEPSLSSTREEDSDFDPLSLVATTETVLEQIHADVRMSLHENDHHIATYVIDSLDERGFLLDSLDDIANALGVDTTDVEEVLSVIQEVAPIGVGARDLRECLLLQLTWLERQDREIPPHTREIIESHLADFGAHKFGQISRSLNISSDALDDIREFIRTQLNPFPLQNSLAKSWRSPSDSRFVAPDVVIDIRDEELTVEVVDNKFFHLRTNAIYSQLAEQFTRKRAKATVGEDSVRIDPDASIDPDAAEEESLDLSAEDLSNASSEDKQHVRQYTNRARMFMMNIQQRRDTLLRISLCICEFQESFLRGGVRELRPLTRALIAQEVGVHESTVSRATANKYVMLPNKKVIPFSDFFTPSLSTKDIIKEIIEQEQKKGEPLTDRRICDLLLERGIRIARRTVAKYRAELGILPSTMR